MYNTNTELKRRVRVLYPVTEGHITLRTDLNWDEEILPVSVSPDRTLHEFEVSARRPFLYMKPCWHRGQQTIWNVGANILLLMTADEARDIYPQFRGPEHGTFSPVVERDSKILGRKHLLRVMLPPGYEDNPLKRYPVLYMQDGKNLFFPEEAFLSREWKVDESVHLLSAMSASDKVIVVGLYSGDRMKEYTKPGYEAYARSVVEEIIPAVNQRFRTLTTPVETAVMGSSLGGVVSFYMGWQYPQVFGFSGCLSSTFSFQDDLIDRVLNEERRATRFYLDSGWPEDNYEVTLAMAMALLERGYEYGRDVVHYAFPMAVHDEHHWAERLHLPLQIFSGTVSMAARGRMG